MTSVRQVYFMSQIDFQGYRQIYFTELGVPYTLHEEIYFTGDRHGPPAVRVHQPYGLCKRSPATSLGASEAKVVNLS